MLLACLSLLMPAAFAANENSGELLFSKNCAPCHGAQAEGVPSEYDEPLVGNLSVAQLRSVIQETMPADNPGTLTNDQAEAIAAYLHREFYSPTAQQERKPVRKALARLTVEQHRLVLADLVGSFLPRVDSSSKTKLGSTKGSVPSKGNQLGLRGSFYNSKVPGRSRNAAFHRIDSQINFDFGTETPDSRIARASRYAIRWEGSLLAPETGLYSFTIHTNQAARLQVNQPLRSKQDGEIYLIDAWIASKSQTEHKAKLYLVGGLQYPVRLEFSKATLGVDDQIKKREQRDGKQIIEDTAFLRLCWQSPSDQTSAPIPTRMLSPESAPVRYVCDTPFPPDDRSYGWVRGVTVSKAWREATTAAAISTASYVADRLDRLFATADSSDLDVGQLRTFGKTFLSRAFRRPIDDAVEAAYLDPIFDNLSEENQGKVELANAEEIVRRIVLVGLTSPRFLFREVGSSTPHHHVASRLALGLWDSLPNDLLREAANRGELLSEEKVRAQATQMLDDPRAKRKINRFLMSWLHLDGDADLSKDRELYPEFNDELADDLRASLEIFLDEMVWSEASDFRQLLLADRLPASERMQEFYKSSKQDSAGNSKTAGQFVATRLDEGSRAGVLSHPYVMAHFAHWNETSPIHRGVFLARGILGISLKPPPDAFAPLAPDLHPKLTTRERVTLQTRDASCMTCHRVINPLGFTLEKFDAVGRMRDSERGKPIDNVGDYQPRSGPKVRLHGARELAEFLAHSPDCHQAFIEQMFHHLIQQPLQAYDSDLMPRLYRSFVESEYNVRELAVAIVTAAALHDLPHARVASSK